MCVGVFVYLCVYVVVDVVVVVVVVVCCCCRCMLPLFVVCLFVCCSG